MSASPPNGSAKRRVRTEAQMSQKRLADRVKHRENRQEHKLRMERMEADIAQIRKNLDTVSAQLRTLPVLSAELLASQQKASQRPAANVFAGPSATPGEAYEMDTSVETPDFPAGRSTGPGRAPPCQERDMPPTEVPASLMSSLFPTPSHVDCRCGVQHHSQSDCLEYRSFAILYETHAAFPQDPLHARSLPRNPSLPNMTLHSYGDNAVTCFLTSFLKGFEMASVETLFGVYFFAYRLMRVCLPLLHSS
ncbi:hypothetical protein ACHAP5_009964 [Fusarium lateritium]